MENKTEAYINLDDYVILDQSNEKNIDCNYGGSNNYNSQENNIVIFNTLDNYINDTIFGPIISKLYKDSISEKIKKKINEILLYLIGKPKIDFKNLRKTMWDGLPDEFPAIRSILWKLMLNYLPNSINEWKDYLIDRRQDYENIKTDFFNLNVDANNIPIDDRSNLLLNDIIKDVKRTRSHMHFFTSAIKTNKNNANPETHADVLTRILYIFGKLHPDIGYVQGMNEIIAPIYYCFSNDPNEFFYSNIEADVFYCFESFMLEIKEIFLQEKDETESGIHYKINKIKFLLEFYDKELFDHFKKEKIELHYFVFRWYTLFFTQEFNMPDTLRLWDSLIVQNEKFDFISYLCLGMITINKKLLLNKDFTNIMYAMQNLGLLEINIEIFIKSSIEIKTKLQTLLHSL